MRRWLALLLALLAGACGGGEGEDQASTTPDPSCASGTRWTGGNAESALMQPGQACIACHGQGEGPQFEVAGTVFAGQHEQNGCFGSAGAQVVVSDADGRTLTLETNAAGNFSYRGPLTLPIHAEVRHQGATRAMAAAVPSGDCNACHTENGTQGSPGRILLP